MGVGSKLLYKRTGALDVVTGSVLAPATSRIVCVLPRGAQVDGNQSGVSAITVHAGHGIITGQKFMVGTDVTKFYTSGTVTATSIPLASGIVTVVDGDAVVNLGADTGTTSPNFDDATTPLYISIDVATPTTPSRVTSNATTGKYEYWSTKRVVWEVVLVCGAPDLVVRDVGLGGLESILALQEVAGGASGTPSASDIVEQYLKGDKLIWRFNDAGTVRYKFLNLAGAGAALSDMTTEP